MIVLDASSVVELLLWTVRGQRVAARIRAASSVHFPELLSVEVAQVIRKLVRNGSVPEARGRSMIEDLAALDAHRYGHDPLLPRILELRHNLTAFDATYVALAEMLGAPLLTFDERIMAAPGCWCDVALP